MTDREAAAMRALKAARDGYSNVAVLMALTLVGMPGGEKKVVEALDAANALSEASTDADVLLTLYDETKKEAA